MAKEREPYLAEGSGRPCPGCGGVLFRRRKLCDACKAKRLSERNRHQYHHRKAVGLCTRCPSPPLPGLAVCESCRGRERARMVSRYDAEEQRAYYHAKIASGMCAVCREPRQGSYVLCSKHLAAQRAYSERSRRLRGMKERATSAKSGCVHPLADMRCGKPAEKWARCATHWPDFQAKKYADKNAARRAMAAPRSPLPPLGIADASDAACEARAAVRAGLAH